VDLLWIFRGSFVDLLWISVDFCRFLWISVDANYVIGLARFSEAGLWSNEVLFFGFFPFAIIFFGGGVDLESVEWIFESSRRHGLAQRGDGSDTPPTWVHDQSVITRDLEGVKVALIWHPILP
jgi:hypothetical protein